MSIPRRIDIIMISKLAVRLALIALWSWIINAAEARSDKLQRSTPRARPTSITIALETPAFEGDDGTLQFAKSAGIYIDGNEAPVLEANRVPATIANPPGTVVILTFGQSNAANSGERLHTARGAVHVFNILDMNFYRASDPLPGASNDTGSIWPLVGDKLIDKGTCKSVLFVPIAFGGTFIDDWAPPAGQCYRRLMFALRRLKMAGIQIDMLCWQQGEAEANHSPMSTEYYCAKFKSMLSALRDAGVTAPVYVAQTTLCEGEPHPFQNNAAIRRAQLQLISIENRVLPGPDTDKIGLEHRRDGCHFSASGQELAAEAWFRAIAD
jgi:hypothetical protein